MQRHYFVNKGPYSQSNGFSISYVRMWELDHKEVWAAKNWCFRIVAIEKTLVSPLDSKETKPVNPRGNQPWIFTRRKILLPHYAKSRLFGKDLDAEKDWGQEKKGMTDDEMAGWHHPLSRHEFEQTLGDSEGQGNLVCYGPQGPQRTRHNLVTEQQHRSHCR